MLTLDDSGNVALAFGLTAAAGAATLIGAAVPFFTSSSNKRLLAAAIGLSAGVMLYVSFVEIFSESNAAFMNLPHSQHATAETSACFFGGAILVALIDVFVHWLERRYSGNDHQHDDDADGHCHAALLDKVVDGMLDPNGCPSGTSSCINPTNVDINGYQQVAYHCDNRTATRPVPLGPSVSFWSHPIQWLREDWAGHGRLEGLPGERATLIRAGLVTALAIMIHNLPEGLATFIATLEDSTVGASLAVAIAIHNIPEGICVAMPVFHATGSRMKGFLLGTISGLSEPLGALIGWAVLTTIKVDAMYAIMFGIVAGMMVFISIQQLIPTAHKFDPNDKFVSFSIVIGMVIMAVSLILFEY